MLPTIVITKRGPKFVISSPCSPAGNNNKYCLYTIPVVLWSWRWSPPRTGTTLIQHGIATTKQEHSQNSGRRSASSVSCHCQGPSSLLALVCAITRKATHANWSMAWYKAWHVCRHQKLKITWWPPNTPNFPSSLHLFAFYTFLCWCGWCWWVTGCVCVCVCVWQREREVLVS